MAHRRNERLHAARLKHYAFATAKGVKETLAVGVEFALVMKIDEEVATVGSKGGVHFLGIIRDKVIDETQTDGGSALDDGHELLDGSRRRVEFLEPRDDVVLLTLDAILDGGRATFQHGQGFNDGGHCVCQFVEAFLFRLTRPNPL